MLTQGLVGLRDDFYLAFPMLPFVADVLLLY